MNPSSDIDTLKNTFPAISPHSLQSLVPSHQSLISNVRRSCAELRHSLPTLRVGTPRPIPKRPTALHLGVELSRV